MHKIYFEKRCIIICPPDEPALSDPNSVEFHLGEDFGLHGLATLFEGSDTLQRIYIPTSDTDRTYRRLCAEFREVNAAGGVDQLQLRDLICITDHCYRRDGIWHLKHTWWYDMLYTDPVNLTPQRDEDISKAAWVAKSSLPPFLKNTYPSIQEVFREAKV